MRPPGTVSDPIHPGARWWKVDFHAHSPASFDFGASEGSRATEETSYRDWLLAYMRNGVDAVVITDHNTHEGIDKARAELVAMREESHEDFRELSLFAGVEITVDGGFHLLGIFDVETPSEDINGLLHRCGFTSERGNSLGTTKGSFAQVVDEIVKCGGLAIPAHADAAKGLFEHDRRNQKDIEDSKQVVAVEAVTEDGAKEAAERGWVRVLGSDAHHLDASGCPEGFEPKYPGSHFTWVKMEEPNLFGIKLALSDGEHSVRPSTEGQANPNDFAHSIIERVCVYKDGTHSAYNFGPWMNTIIGGRGVGKSTIIELIRLAMGRFSDLPAELQDDNEWFSPEPGRRSGSRFWDRNTKVEVYLLRLGRNYRVVWSGDKPTEATIEAFSAGMWQAEEGSPRDRFALMINSQKQIYETARDPQSLLKAIDDQPSIDYVAWKEAFEELCGQYRTQRSELNELNIKIASEDRVRGELSDIQVQLQHISQLRDSPEAKELDQLAAEEQKTTRLESVATRFEAAAKALVEEYKELQPGDEPENESAQHQIWDVEATRRGEISQAYRTIAEATQSLTSSRTKWEGSASASPRRVRIEELNSQLQAIGSDDGNGSRVNDANDDHRQLMVSKGDRETILADIEKARTKRQEVLEETAETLGRITQHRHELTTRRKELALSLSDGDLKLEVLAQADDSCLEPELRQLVQKQTSYDQVFSDQGLPVVLEHPFKPGRDARVAQLKELLLELRSLGAEAPLLETFPTIAIDQRFFSHLGTLDQHAYETEIALWFPEDRLRVRYRQEGEKGLREIDQGSPGQKTAALLAVVLQLSNDPLLLDQPEDDLDNKLIYDLVVTTLRRIKSERQIIVVTHNANVVVNADAEHVTILRHGIIPDVEGNGSIQGDNIKQSICLIMEGGEPAFEARYQRLMG